MKNSERRQTKRFPIRVLVNCLPPGTPKSRNGHASHGWEMWARDLGDNGVRLEWSQAWAARDYSAEWLLTDEKPSRKPVTKLPTSVLKKGSQVLLDGLVYDDDGSKLIKGKVQWAKIGKKGQTCEFGVLVTSPDRRSYFRALAA